MDELNEVCGTIVVDVLEVVSFQVWRDAQTGEVHQNLWGASPASLGKAVDSVTAIADQMRKATDHAIDAAMRPGQHQGRPCCTPSKMREV